MPLPKKFFHDRLVLLLLSISAFCVALGTVLVVLRLDSDRAGGYIVQYRANLGISAFKTGGSAEIISFIVFLAGIFVLHFFIAMRSYHLRRHFSITMLSLAIMLQVLAIIVSNSLLVLR